MATSRCIRSSRARYTSAIPPGPGVVAGGSDQEKFLPVQALQHPYSSLIAKNETPRNMYAGKYTMHLYPCQFPAPLQQGNVKVVLLWTGSPVGVNQRAQGNLDILLERR